MGVATHKDRFPAQLPNQATLFLTTVDASTARAVSEVISSAGLAYEEPFPDVQAVGVGAKQLRQLSVRWAKQLGQAQLKATRCRLISDDTNPSLSNLMRSQRLWDLIRWIDAQWVRGVLRAKRLTTFFQPIVESVQPDRIFAYECLLRGVDRDGRLIAPKRMFAAAKAVGLLRSLDEAARITAIRSASQRKLSGCVFVNFIPRSIDEPSKCMAPTLQAISDSGIPAERFVFEVVESERIRDVDQLLRLLDYLRQFGCRVALDDVGAGYSSLNLLARIKPDFIKVDMSLVHDVQRDSYVRRITAKLLELAKELRVETVVEGVEEPDQWRWVKEHGAEYAQGYLFARPARLPPSSSFSGVECPAAVACGGQDETDAQNTLQTRA